MAALVFVAPEFSAKAHSVCFIDCSPSWHPYHSSNQENPMDKLEIVVIAYRL